MTETTTPRPAFELDGRRTARAGDVAATGMRLAGAVVPTGRVVIATR